MTTIKHFLYLSILLFSCNNKIVETNKANRGKNYRLYHQYCFYNQVCTDSMLVSLIINDENLLMQKKGKRYEKIYKTIEVKRIDLENSDDRLVIDQLLQSLEIYNLSASRKKWPLSEKLDHTYFFNGQQFKKNYHVKFNHRDFLNIENLEELKLYDFKRKFVEKEVANNIEITFENGIQTKIICNKEFHKEVLFPEYLNFISKNHRLTPKNIKFDKK